MDRDSKRTILLVGLGENFVESFLQSKHCDEYSITTVDDPVAAIMAISRKKIDVIVYRFDQSLINWNSFIEIVLSIFDSTRLVLLFEGTLYEELDFLRTKIDVCLPLSKPAVVCFEYIHRLFLYSVSSKDGIRRLYSRGMNTFDIDFKNESVKKNEKNIPLTYLEYIILVHLIQNKEKIINRQEFFSVMYKHETKMMSKDDRRVDVHIAKLRQKIGSMHIRSIRGQGYRWDCL